MPKCKDILTLGEPISIILNGKMEASWLNNG